MKIKDNEKPIVNVYEHLEIIALRSVSTEKDAAYTYRKICRWFSREFNTSLPIVIKLPVEFILQHYYEDRFESLSEEELTNMMRHHADPDFVKDTEQSDDEFLIQIQEEAQKALAAKELELKKKAAEQQSNKDKESKEVNVSFDDLNINNET